MKLSASARLAVPLLIGVAISLALLVFSEMTVGLTIATALDVILLAIVYVLTSRELVRRERMRVRLLEQKHMLEEQVRDRTAELSALSSDLQHVQEVEKSELARELHDEMGSILVSAKMDVSWAISRIRQTHPEVTEKLQRALNTLDDGVEIKRRIIDDLRPALLDNLGLGAAITWHVEQMSERSGLLCTVLVPEDDSPLPGHISIALFRVAQEALTNIVRHAKAANTRVELQRTAEEVRLEIKDDGDGLPPAAQAGQTAHGILSMRQRILGVGGEFDMRSGRALGTVIRVRVPLGAEQKAARRGAHSNDAIG